MYDLIIIGAGPAGITASVYAARKRLNLLVVTKDIGGQAALSGDVENYTGYQFISGPELAGKFEEHLKRYPVHLKENEAVVGLSVSKEENNSFIVRTEKSRYEAKSVIVASGKRSKQLGIPGEAEFKNRGLTYCATCDGPLFSGKDVAVIGGGNSALDAALQLVSIARRIYLINIAAALTADPVMQDKVVKSDKVSILNESRVTAVRGEKLVEAIQIKSAAGREEELTVQGIFVEIGLIPNSGFAEILERNELGEIKVNSFNETNVPGIFAAGDVTDVPEKQIVIAAGEGSKAALSVFRYLARLK